MEFMQQNVVGNNYESTELVDLHNTGLNTNCAGIELCEPAFLISGKCHFTHTCSS
jgi:hypothetical protein